MENLPNKTIVCANQLPPTVSTIGRLGDTGELRRDDWHNAICTKDSNNKQGTADSFHEALRNSTSKEITHELVPYSNHSSVAVLDFLNILIDRSQPGEVDGKPSENWPCVYSEDLVQQALKTNTEIVLDPVEKDNNMTAWALLQLGRKSQSGTLRILMNQLIYKRRWQIMLRPEKLEWKRKRNILRLQDRYGPESIYGSIIGYVVRREHWCEGCKLQKGPFAYCIIVLGHMGSGCTNCHYQVGSAPCSFYGVLRQMTLQDQAAFEANSAPQSISGAVHQERHDDIPISR
ncbi:hypothetical protein F4806DRAFT_445643 [Annulohypoxylon nitens]|nr:hypothetical protein F4806DRAFT_445643 [Annulohypoxylon nitens]